MRWIVPLLLLSHWAAVVPATWVQSTQPAAESFGDADRSIEIRFDRPIDPSSLDDLSLRVFGRWSGPASIQWQWLEGGRLLRVDAGDGFSAGETVTVRLARSIRDLDGEAMPKGYAFQFWARSAPAALAFEQDPPTVAIRRLGESRVRAYGAFAGDLDGDGDSDLAVPCEDASDLRIFLNDGFGGYGEFEVMPMLAGGGPSANDGADFDRDGKLDLILGNAFSGNAMLLRGRGDGTFDPLVPYPTTSSVRAASVVDLDGDACEDVVTASRRGDRYSILIGDGNGRLSPAENFDSGERGETALAVGECNGDGLLDVFLGCNDSGRLLLLLNDGEGGLIPSASVDAKGRPWVVVSGDLDGDGNADVAAANSYADNCAIAFSDGEGGLSETISYPTGAFPLAIDLGDLDGDGDLDMITSNYLGQSWTLYRNDGRGRFGDRIDLRASSAGSCAILHDRDGDGVLDFTGIDELSDEIFLFEHAASPPPPLSRALRLLQLAPNPFDLEARIEFEIAVDSVVELRIYDLRGRALRRLLTPALDAGTHAIVWDGLDADGRPTPNGVYRLSLRALRAGRPLELPITRLR